MCIRDRPKVVRIDASWLAPLVLAALGGRELWQYQLMQPISSEAGLMIGLDLLLALVMGALRAASMTVWSEGSILYRQGTLRTILLWAVSVLLHAWAGVRSGLGAQTMLGYIAVTLTAQKAVIQRKRLRQ